MAREGNTRERVLRLRRPMAGEDLAHRAEQEGSFPLHGGTRRDVSHDRLSPHELMETEEI